MDFQNVRIQTSELKILNYLHILICITIKYFMSDNNVLVSILLIINCRGDGPVVG